MKKLIILSATTLALMTYACKNEEKPAEEVTVETAVEQMTEAIADSNAVAPAADSAATASH